MNTELSQRNNKGMSLVEVILSIALFGIMILGLVGVYWYGLETSSLVGKRNKAVFLAQQGLEVTRSIRDMDYANLTNGDHGVAVNGSGAWEFSGSSDVADGYERIINITDYDTNIKQVVSTINWDQNLQRTGTLSLTTLLSFWQEVLSGSWANPLLGSSYDVPGNSDGLRIDTNATHAFIIFSNSGDVYSFDISDPANIVFEDSISISGPLNDIVLSGNYAYVASSSNSGEIVSIDISNPGSLSVADTVNVSGNQNMLGLAVSGNYLYGARASSSSEFNIFDISNPNNIGTLGTLNLSSGYNDVYVSGNYAYLAGDPNSGELAIVNISNPLIPLLINSFDISGNGNGESIVGRGNYVYLYQNNSLIYVIDISNPLLPNNVSSYDPIGNVGGMNISNTLNYLFIANSESNAELKIVDIADPLNPVFIGQFDNLNNSLNDVRYQSAGDYVVVVGSDNAAEIQTIQP